MNNTLVQCRAQVDLTCLVLFFRFLKPGHHNPAKIFNPPTRVVQLCLRSHLHASWHLKPISLSRWLRPLSRSSLWRIGCGSPHSPETILNSWEYKGKLTADPQRKEKTFSQDLEAIPKGVSPKICKGSQGTMKIHRAYPLSHLFRIGPPPEKRVQETGRRLEALGSPAPWKLTAQGAILPSGGDIALPVSLLPATEKEVEVDSGMPGHSWPVSASAATLRGLLHPHARMGRAPSPASSRWAPHPVPTTPSETTEQPPRLGTLMRNLDTDSDNVFLGCIVHLEQRMNTYISFFAPSWNCSKATVKRYFKRYKQNY